MASPRRESTEDLIKAAIGDFTARHKAGVIVTVAVLVAAFFGGGYLHLTLGNCILIAALITPAAVAARRGVRHWWWTRQFRRLLAGEGLPYPGRKAAAKWRKRETNRIVTMLRQFPAAAEAHGVINKAKITPTPRKPKSRANGDITVRVYPARLGIKEGVKKLQTNAQDFARICGAPDMRVKPLGDGSAELTFLWTERLASDLPVQEMGDAGPDRLEYGQDEDGNVLSIAMMLSVLIVGMTGSGKSSLLWALITAAQRKVRFWIYVIDPKGGQELGDFKGAVGRTIGRMTVKDWGTLDAAKRIINDVEAEMKRRQDELLGQRKWTQAMSDEYPLIMLPIDEALELMLKIDKETLGKLLTIISQGRAAGVMVILLSQAAQKSVLDMLRTIIAQRLALYLEGPTDTGMVFGRMDAENEGARCSEINTPGIGFARIDGQRGYQMFKAYYVDDHDIAAIMDHGLPDGMGGSGKVEPNELYCVYYYRTSDKQLLYIGITNDFSRRDAEHKAAFLKGDPKHYWYQYVDATKTVVRAADGKEAAKAEESREIKRWQPPGNRAENVNNPRQGQPIEALPQAHWWSRSSKPVELAALEPAPVQPLPVEPDPVVEPEPEVVAEPVNVGPVALEPVPAPVHQEMTTERFRRTRRDNYRAPNMRPRAPKAKPEKVPARVGPDYPSWLEK